MANESNLEAYRLKRSQKNANKIINNFFKPNNIKKQRLSYRQRHMDEDQLEEYIDGLFKKVKEFDEKVQENGAEPLKSIDLNARSKLAETGMKFINMKKESGIEDEQKEFEEYIKTTTIISQTYRNNPKHIQEGQESKTVK